MISVEVVDVVGHGAAVRHEICLSVALRREEDGACGNRQAGHGTDAHEQARAVGSHQLHERDVAESSPARCCTHQIDHGVVVAVAAIHPPEPYPAPRGTKGASSTI